MICPVHKSDPRNDPNNYRGITLLNVMGKLFTAILCDRITQWLLQDNSYQKHNLASTKIEVTDCIFIVNTLIEREYCKKSTLILCYVDFRKGSFHVKST